MSLHQRKHSPAAKSLFRLLIILVLVLPSSALVLGPQVARATTVSAWNPNVSCQAVLTSDHGVIGNHFDTTTMGALESGGPFGVFATQQSQIGTTSDLQPDLNAPCTYPNVNGTIAPTLVEIHGVSLTSGTHIEFGSGGGKCGTKYQGINGYGSYPGGATFCTTYGVFQDTSEFTGNCEVLQTPPKICIRLEIDRDWIAAGYCGTVTFCNVNGFDNLIVGQKIDVQGFVAWHPPSSAGHGYSSWELHPVTAWRLTPTTSSISEDFSWTPSKPVQGETVTFTGTATGGTAPYTFRWNFGDGTTSLQGNPVSHSYTASGSYPVSLTVTDSIGLTATSSKTVVIAPLLTTSFTYSPSTPSTGLSISFTGSASGGISPYTFNWSFGDGGTATGSSVTHAYSSTGSYPVILTTSDSSSHIATASNNIVVSQRASSTGLTCSNPVVAYQTSACNATVSDTSPGTPGQPTGTVVFSETGVAGSFSSTSCLLVSASCAVNFTATASGSAVIVASYGGDSNYSGSSGSATLTISQRVSVTSLGCTSAGAGGSQSCTATVSDASPGSVVTPSGSVSFASNSTGVFSSNSCLLSASGTPGIAACVVTYTPIVAGTHVVTGSYGGDSIHQTSQGSAMIGFGKDSTITVINCSPSTVPIGQQSTCTVTVSDSSSAPTSPGGSVSFASSGAGVFSGSSCGLASTNASSSTCQVGYTPSSGGGTHSLTATYNGDSTHSSSAGAFSLSVSLRGSSTSVGCSPSSVVVNQAASCTALVSDSSGSGASIPSGIVSFSPGGSCTLVGGSCSVSITALATGSLTVSASYTGDSSHSSSVGSTTITAGSRATSTSISCSPNPAVNNTSTKCTVTVTDTDVGTSITPTGLGSFVSNSTGVFSSSSCTLAASGTLGVANCFVSYSPKVTGSHTLNASYAGDPSHLASGGSGTVSVIAAPPASAYALVVSVDGKISRLYANGTMTLVGQPVTTPLRSVAWKPDGSYALITGDSGVFLKYDGSSITAIPTGISSGLNFWSVAWKPDGSYALVGGSVGTLFKYDGTSVTVVSNPVASTIFSISWNPSGSLALLAGKAGLVLTFDGTTVPRQISSGVTVDLGTVAWSPSGSYALIGGSSATLLRFNGTGVSPVNTSGVPSANAIKAISFNQAGSLALLVGDNGMVLSWNGSSLTVLPVITFSWLTGVSWSVSGTAYIVGGSGTVLTFANGTLAKLTTSPTSTTQYRAIAWKPQ